MSQILLSEMNRAAQEELQSQEKYAESVAEVISARQKDNSKFKLILQLVGVSVFSVGLLVLAAYGAGIVAMVNFYPIWITLAAFLTCTAFCGLLIYRQVSTMKYFRTIFSAKEDVERIRSELRTRIATLPDNLSTALESSKNSWKMQINLHENVVEHLNTLEMQVVSKADIKSERINKFIVAVFYLAVTACGLFGCVACYPAVYTLMNGTLQVVGEWIGDASELAAGVTGVACAAGFFIQFWPVRLFTKSQNGTISWWAPIMLLTGLATVFLTTFAIIAVIALIGIVIVTVMMIIELVKALFQVAVAIIGIVLGIAFIIGVLSGS